MPTNFGSLPNVVERQGASSRKVSQCWQVARVAGKVPNLDDKVSLSMYVTYNSVSIHTPWAVAGPHGQLSSIIMGS